MLTTDELVIDQSLTINGPGPNLLGVYRSSQTSFRIFHVMPGFAVTIAGLTINGGAGDQPSGSGILNDHANLTIDSCAVQNSFAAQYNSSSGIYNDGSAGSATLTIVNSSVSGNYAYDAGGGIHNDASNSGTATVSLSNSSVNENVAAFNSFPYGGGHGGGIANDDVGGHVILINSIVSDNSAGVSDPFPIGSAGGISNYGTLTITNSTINGNHCPMSGGGIENGGTLTISNSTVSANGATGQHDGQPWGHGSGIVGEVTFTNSTLSNNYANLSTGGIEAAVRS